MLKLTPNYMHEFTRIQYSSADNKTKYSELLKNIQTVNSGKLDLELAAAGLRPAFITSIDPVEYKAYSTTVYENYKMHTIILGKNKVNQLGFYGVIQEYTEGDPYVLRVAVCKTEEDAQEWEKISSGEITGEAADRLMGKLLGYPECCINEFIQRWHHEQFIDLTFTQAAFVSDITVENRDTKLPSKDGSEPTDVTETWKISLPDTMPFEAHTMLRWVGVRLVPHLPCKFDCQVSIAQAKRFYEFKDQSQYKEYIEHMYEMQQWPIEWSVMHGIVELYTPCFRVFTRGDCTIEKYVVQKHSTYFPEDGSRGARFPFKTKKNKVSESKSFKNSLIDNSVWEENGYLTQEAMESAHNLMLQAVDLIDLPNKNVLDLGCGNGIFIEKLYNKVIDKHNDRFSALPCGVELAEHRIKSAMDRLHFGKLWWADMFAVETWTEDNYGVTALMPMRLIEYRRDADVENLKQGLAKNTQFLLLYLTSDAKEQITMAQVVERTGLDAHWEPCTELLSNEEVDVQIFKLKG